MTTNPAAAHATAAEPGPHYPGPGTTGGAPGGRGTRADMIAAGDLVDVTPVTRQAGLELPVAVTRAAWQECLAWAQQDGQLGDVLWMLAQVLRGSDSSSSSRITVRLGSVYLVALSGAGDAAGSVITVIKPGED